eukprot:CAMPEP_0173323868 /NCGR_PEP_ID=MMETSP1143-20121109/30748_1 /TAXON_ID=483371 /ORGANISM="non described non described, Strain CCMP2298" /LENGTH=370 /DNA_ID=CAMNT_0014267865 /DNA_START=324 /DNA_END=1437 /DNA_ORIENTATION=-
MAVWPFERTSWNQPAGMYSICPARKSTLTPRPRAATNLGKSASSSSGRAVSTRLKFWGFAEVVSSWSTLRLRGLGAEASPSPSLSPSLSLPAPTPAPAPESSSSPSESSESSPALSISASSTASRAASISSSRSSSASSAPAPAPPAKQAFAQQLPSHALPQPPPSPPADLTHPRAWAGPGIDPSVFVDVGNGAHCVQVVRLAGAVEGHLLLPAQQYVQVVVEVVVQAGGGALPCVPEPHVDVGHDQRAGQAGGARGSLLETREGRGDQGGAVVRIVLQLLRCQVEASALKGVHELPKLHSGLVALAELVVWACAPLHLHLALGALVAQVGVAPAAFPAALCILQHIVESNGGSGLHELVEEHLGADLCS